MKTTRIFLSFILPCLILTGMSQLAHAAKYYVYQLPDGSRVITGKPIYKKTHKLVSKSRSEQGIGRAAASRYSKQPRTVARWETLISEAADKNNVDVALVKAVIHTESYFNPDATSRVGASGLMQLMPKTARMYGVTDIYDPEQNLHAGVKHLRYLIDKYPKKLSLALAAYNAGESAVYYYDGIPPYSETRAYVQKVLEYHSFYKNAL